MKKNLMSLLLALLSAVAVCCGFAACSDSDPAAGPDGPVAEMSVALTKGAAGYYELNFTVTTKNVAACAYICEKSGAAERSADEILASGKAVATLNGASAEKVSGLEAGTAYRIVAAVKGADGSTALSEPLEMSTTGNGQIDMNDMQLNYLSYAEYSFNSDTQVANYVVTIGNARPDSNGNPASPGDVLLILDLYGALSPNQSDIHLPAGTYEMSAEEGVSGTWTNAHSGIYMRTESEVSLLPLIGGVVTVEESADIYRITAEMVMLSGEAVKATFEGRISFLFLGSSNYGTFSEPQHIVFDHYSDYSTRYYGNWMLPHADDMNITFYLGEMSGEDYLSDGYKLCISPYMHKQADYNRDPMPLEEGVYTVNAATTGGTLAIPMTIDPGRIIDFYGMEYLSDTYLSYIDGKTGMRKRGMIAAGSMTVVKTGSETYRFEFDFLTQEGIPVTGSYEGEFRMKNYNDTDTSIQFPLPQRPISTLTSDVQLAFADGTTCLAFYMGPYLYPDYDSWMIWFNYDLDTQAPIAGHYLTTEMLVPKGLGASSLPAGTYTMGWEPGDYVAFPGFLLHTEETLYSWFADFSRVDADGIPYDLAPIDAGSFTVEKSGSGYKVVMNFTDDAGHAIRGEWNGPILLVDITADATSAAQHLPKSKLHR